MTEKGEVCTAEVFDYETWKRTTETNVPWKTLHLETETLPLCVGNSGGWMNE